MGVIDDIKTNLGNAYTKLETKGATIPEHKNMENLEDTIDSVSVEKETQQKTVGLSMASGNQVVTPDANKVLSQVTIEKPATLNSGNIKKDVNIGGVVGTLEEGITPTGNINITNTNQTDVTNYATAQVVESNLVPENIRNGTSILGVQGNMNSGITNHEVIDRLNALPTATETSADFIQVGGVLYQKKATAISQSTITNLSGTTWLFNNVLDFSDFDPTQITHYYYVNFESNNVNFNYFLIQYPSSERGWELYYNGNSVYLIDGWQFTEDKTITITDGTDVTNTDLIDWLKENATLQTTTVYSYEEVSASSAGVQSLGGAVGNITLGDRLEIINNELNVKSMELLWTNSTTGPFSAQTITLSSSDYDYLLIEYTSTEKYHYLMKKGFDARLITMFTWSGTGWIGENATRVISYNTVNGNIVYNSLNVQDCVAYYINENGVSIRDTTSNANVFNRPINIYGIKL